MKSSKQVLIAVFAVLIMLMPTSALAVAFSSTESDGEEFSFENVDNFTALRNLLENKNGNENKNVKLINNIVVTANIKVVGTHELKSDDTIVLERASSYKGAFFTIGTGAVLTLSGSVVIDGTGLANSAAISVTGGEFVMKDNSSITNNERSGNAYGSGVSVSGGLFTMNGGTIHHNKATYGAGVYVSSGEFIMNCGTISNNEASKQGGGVLTSGTNVYFIMNDGLITGNKAVNGGGVRIDGGSSFTMNGGTISGNTAYSPENNGDGNGGGVIVARSLFTMNGGNIEHNISKRDTGNTFTSGWGAGVFLLTNLNDGSMTTFRFHGGSIRNNGLSDSNDCVNGDGRQIYARDIKCNVLFNGGGVIEDDVFIRDEKTLEFSDIGSSVYFANKVYTSKWVDTDVEVNVATFCEKTDLIQGVIEVTGNLKMSLVSTMVTEDHGLTVRYDASEDPENVTISNGEIIGDVGEIFTVVVVGELHDIYVDPLHGDDSKELGTFTDPVETLNMAYSIIGRHADAEDNDYVIHIIAGTIIVDGNMSISNRSLIDGSFVVSIEPKSLTILKGTTNPLFTVNGVLDVTNIEIDGNGNTNSLFTVSSSGSLTLGDGAKIKNNYSSAVMLKGGNLVLSGTITGCGSPTSEGGAVNIDGGSFIMNGGTISECISKYGAAVRVLENGTMTMNDGLIEKNVSVDNASAVSCKYGSFTMNGGSIINNTAGGESSYGIDKAIGAVQILYGAKFTLNDGIVAGNVMRNTYYDSRSFQIYALYGGLVEINGGVIDDVVTETDNELVGSMLVHNVFGDDKLIAECSISSGFVGELYFSGSNNESVWTINNECPLNGAGSVVIRYDDTGYVVSTNANVNGGHYLNCTYNGAKSVYSESGNIGEPGTNNCTLDLEWGSIHEVRYDSPWVVMNTHKNFITGQLSTTTLSSWGVVKSGDIITVTIDGDQGGKIYFSGVERELDVIDNHSTTTYTVGAGCELIYIIPATGALILDVDDTQCEYGVAPSDIDLRIYLANAGSTVTPCSWAATYDFTIEGSYSLIDGSEPIIWKIRPAANLDVGEYTVNVTVSNSFGMVGQTQFTYVVTAPTKSTVTIVQPTYGGETVGTIVVSMNDNPIPSGTSCTNGTDLTVSVTVETGYAVTNIRVNGEIVLSGTIQVSEDITISADVVPIGGVSVTVVVPDLTVGYTDVSVPISIYNGSSKTIDRVGVTWIVTEGYVVGVNNSYSISPGQTDNVMFDLRIPNGLGVSEHTVDLTMGYSVEGRHYNVFTTVTFSVVGIEEFSARLLRGTDEIPAGSTDTYVIDNEYLTYTIVASDSISFAGIDSILATSISSVGIVGNTLTVVFDLDGSSTGCFYVDLIVCGDSGSVCVGFYLQVCPSLEILTDPSV